MATTGRFFRMRVPRVLVSAALALPALLAAGCGRGSSVAPVSGAITMDGKPLPNAAVFFQPIGSEKNINPGPGSDAMTDANGKYTLKVVGTKQIGAVVGWHRVEISAYIRDKKIDPKSDQRERPPKNLVPPEYNDKTTLEIEVPRAGTNKADFNVKSR